MIIWGVSGHAQVIADIIRLQGRYKIAGFLDDTNTNRKDSEFCMSHILRRREQLTHIQEKGVKYIILGFGECHTRMELSKLVLNWVSHWQQPFIPQQLLPLMFR